jgi:hypothetical protein
MYIRAFTLLLAVSAASASLAAQDGQLTIPDFKALERKASDSVNMTLGPWLLHTAGVVLDDDDPDQATIKKLLAGITSIEIRRFRFDQDHAYSETDIDSIRGQLSAPGWTSLMKVRDHTGGESVDISILVDNDRTRGFALVASQPREFTIVNIVGSINLRDLPELEGHLHLPITRIDDGVAARPATQPSPE